MQKATMPLPSCDLHCGILRLQPVKASRRTVPTKSAPAEPGAKRDDRREDVMGRTIVALVLVIGLLGAGPAAAGPEEDATAVRRNFEQAFNAKN